MRYLSPREKKCRRSRRVRIALFILGAFVLFTLLDFPLLHLFYNDPPQHINDHDWYRLLRILGYMGTWILGGIIFMTHDRDRHRGLALIFAPLLAGAAAELLKLIIARERPVHNGIIQEGLYHFRAPFSGFSDNTNLGFPSSHAAVAFGGCLMLACFLPRARTLLLLLAIGCGITRMLPGAHFATDVVGGALLGWASVIIIRYFAAKHIPELRPRYRMPC